VRKEDAVFLTHEGKPLTRVAGGLLFSALGKRAGIDGKRFYHHQCKRYMATTQLAMGRSPLDVHLRAKDVFGDADMGGNYWDE
jgi:hypothetical protein